MKFAEPLWLLAGLVACGLLTALLWHAAQVRRRTLESFAVSHLLPQLTASVSPQLRLLKQVFWVVAVAALFVALARPQLGFYWQEVKRRGIDILIAVDTSKSMLAQDVQPNRLTRAKLAVNDLVDQIGGDRVGLIAFAGESFLQCPLTLDHTAFLENLESLDTNTIPRGGTDVASAIQEAEAAYVNEGQNHKILLLITDGEDLEGHALDTARDAAKRGIKIYTVGVGSTGGELIPIPDEKGGVAFAKDERGNFVKSHLDESMLKQIAEVTGGAYEPLGARGEGLIKIYESHLKTLPQYDLASRQQRVYYERFQWPLGLAVTLFIIELLLIERRTPVRRELDSNDIRPQRTMVVKQSQRRRPGASAAASALIVLTGLFLFNGTAQASPAAAEKAYQKGDYKKAWETYALEESKNPDSGELQYNTGAAAYKQGDWGGAAQSFQKALGAKDQNVVQQSSYNLGNALYRIGQQTEKSDVQKTIQTWEQALQAYEGAMRIKPDDADAKYNYDYVKKKLDELKKQQPPQDKNKDKDKDQDKDQNKDQNKDQQNQNGGQDKNQQNQQNPNQNQNGGQDKNNPNNQNQPNQQNQQGGQGDDKKNQQGQNGQNNQKPGDQKQPSKPDQKPGSQPNSQQPQQAKNGEEGGAAEESRPGKMSKGEALNLLDSAKGDEKKVLLLQGKQNHKVEQDEVKKDW
jgi:Ca-activated chloride channel homolog